MTVVAREYYATGHRKNATAKVWLIPGEGKCTVNGKAMSDYIKRPTLEVKVIEVLQLASMEGTFDVRAQCLGGGLSGQAGALRHGIAKALVLADQKRRGAIKKAGLLTRDARKKERKKYGQPGARARYQFSKR